MPMLLRLTLAALLGAVAVAGAHAVDTNKTLRVAFPIAENGFDPQAAYDSYSFYVIGGIFDPLYVYDYFARPARMIPNTAAALPEVTDQGRTYTIKVRPGIRFAADPAFKGKPRELTAEDYVYSLKRIFDPKVRSYWLYIFEGNLVGLDEPLATARKGGTLELRCRARGTARARPLHAADQVPAAELRLRVVAHHEPVLGGGARSRRRLQGRVQPRDGKSGGHRRLPAEAVDARPAHRARSQSGLSRSHVSGAGPGQRARGCRDRARADGQEAPARRQRGHLDHRGGAAAAPVVRLRPARLRRAAGDACPPTCSTGRSSSPSTRSGASRCTARSRRRSRSSISTSTTPLSAATRRRRSRCGARSAWVTTATRPSRACSRARPSRRRSRCLRRCTATTRSTFRPTATTRAPRARCSTSSATRTATATAIARLPDGKPLTLVLASTPDNAARASDELWKQQHGRARHQDHVPQEQVARAQQDVGGGPAA